MPVTDVSPRSHIDTPAWQSFEQRMRVRAAQRRAAKRRRRLQYAALAFIALCGVATGFFAVSSLPHLARVVEVRAPDAPTSPRVPVPVAAEPLPVPASLAMVDNPLGDSTLHGEPAPESASLQATVDATAGARVRADRIPQPQLQPVETNARNTDTTDRGPVGTSLREPERTNVPPPAPAPSRSLETPAPETLLARRSAPAAPPLNTESIGRERADATPIAPVSPPPASVESSSESNPAEAAPPAVSLTPTPAPPAVDPMRARAAVRGTIERYRSAYERLDAAAARAVWPGVDASALSRAFGSLESQRLSFDDCTINIAGAIADATCTGRASIVPKIGGGSQTVRRTWTFKFAQAGESWRIASANVR